MSTATLAADPRSEATRIVELASGRGVPVRVMGGVAVGLCCPSAQSPPLARPYRDIDFAGRADQGRQITAVFESAGYEADAETTVEREQPPAAAGTARATARTR